jgi:hypothetical protein
LAAHEDRLSRRYLKGGGDDATNAILGAVSYNLRLVPAWLRRILRLILISPLRACIS